MLGGFTGTFVWYHAQKATIKNRVAQYISSGIDKSELVLLKFTYAESKSKLRWEHSKEFEFKGQMYDIVETEYTNDSVYYWCWHDKDETHINNQIDKLASLVLPKKSEKTEYSITQVKQTIQLYCDTHISVNSHLQTTKINYKKYQFYYSSEFFKPLSPPPKTNC